MRLTASIAVLLMAIAGAAMLASTSDGGLATSIAFQRTDLAAGMLALTLTALALSALGLVMAGVVLSVLAVILALSGLPLIVENPMISDLGRVFLFVGPGIALLYSLVKRLMVVRERAPIYPRMSKAAPSVSPVAGATPVAEPEETVTTQTAETTQTTEALTPDNKTIEPENEAKIEAGIAVETAVVETDVAVEKPTGADSLADRDGRSPIAALALGEDGEDDRASKTEAAPERAQASLADGEDAPSFRKREADPFVDEDEKNRLDFMRMRAAEASDPEEGLTLWKKISEQYPDYYPALNMEAQLLLQLGRKDEARARLSTSLERAPEDVATLSLAARYAGADKDFAAAEEYWRAAFALEELNEAAATGYVNSLTQQGKFDLASARFHEFCDSWPNTPRLIRAGAAAAEGRGDHGEAHALWKAVMELEPGVLSDARRSINALLAGGDVVEAAREALAYQKVAPEESDPQRWMERVLRAAADGSEEQAAETLDILGARDPAIWATYIDARLAAGDIPGAEHVFQRAIERGLSAPELLRAGGVIALRARRRDLEAERWTALMDLAPNDVTAVRRAAIAHSFLGDLERASELIDIGLTHMPNEAELLALKANMAGRRGNWRQALDIWKIYGAEHGLSPNVLAQCGRALWALGRLDEAEQLLTAGLGEYADAPELLMEKALVADARVSDAQETAAVEADHSAPPGNGPDWGLESIVRWKAAIDAAPQANAAWRGYIMALGVHGDRAGALAAIEQATDSMSGATTLLADPKIKKIIAGDADVDAAVVTGEKD